MERPKCEWKGGDECQRPATHVVTFVHNDRSRLSCKDHLDNWGRHGRGYWVSMLEGFVGDMANVIADILSDNESVAEATKAGDLRIAEGYRHQLARVKAMAGAL
jgi:hypothetical protein